MSRKLSAPSNTKLTKNLRVPKHPLISDHPVGLEAQRETLQRVLDVIALVNTIEREAALTPQAKEGLFCIQSMVTDSLNYINELSRQQIPH